MPVQYLRRGESCVARWGNKGAEYPYTCGNEESRNKATKKALAQASAIGEFALEKISFDYDGTLTRQDIQDKAKEYVNQNILVYIISARHFKSQDMLNIAKEIGIPESRIYATGSNTAKIEVINKLNINKHFDNNNRVINQLGNIGELVK